MTVVKRVIDKKKLMFDSIYIWKEKRKLHKFLLDNTKNKKIYFFSVPKHSNLGDQAQYFCWLRLLKEWYPDHEIVSIPEVYRRFDTLRIIHERITPNDLVFIHSGYLIFDPHPELPFILDIVRAFYDYPITILPQTVNLMGQWYKDIVSKQFNGHPNLTICCRDEVSLANAKTLFSENKFVLLPDVVTSLIGNSEFQYKDSKRNGVLLCVRNDGEKLYSDSEITALKKRFDGVRVDITDTTITADIWDWDSKRETLIRKILKRFSEYQVIITDRYHGTIFSQIVNTPVVVISSTDHKLSSGVKWFPNDTFGDNISFAKDLDEAYEKAQLVLNRNGKVVENPSWFKDNYYSNRI